LFHVPRGEASDVYKRVDVESVAKTDVAMTGKEKEQAELERTRFLCKNSLKYLATVVLKMKDWDVCHDELEAYMRVPSKRRHIEFPRGHLKSSIITKAWVIQCMLRNPDIRILIANAVWNNSRKFLRSIQKYIARGSELSRIFGTYESNHWNQDECTISMRTQILDAPTFTTTGIEKEETSQHYDLIIGDDLCTFDNSQSGEMRQKVKDYYRGLLDLLEPTGRIVVIGTRKHQDDLYGMLLEQEAWSNFIKGCYTAEGEPVFPKKFTKEYLQQLRRDKGAYYFACEYLNNPIDESNAPFKAGMIKYYDAANMPPLSMFMTVDPAIQQKVENDWTALVVCGMDKDRNIYVVDRARMKALPTEVISRIFQMVEKWSLNRIGIEKYAMQLMLKYEIQAEQRRRGKFFTIEEMSKPKDKVKKENFIYRLEPFFEQGLIRIRHDMTDLVDEILSFPNGKHDDLIDALAYQLDYLVPAAQNYKASVLREGTMGWWAAHYLKKPASDWQSAFLADLKEPSGSDL
jgi:predicted phage terminase large subunit-like protein